MKKRLFLVCLIVTCFVSGIFAQFTCGDSLLDTRDGKKYPTVLIGSQCWMKQNLNYGAVVSSYTTNVTHTDVHNDANAEKYCQYNTSSNCDQYGGLYEWNELMTYSTTAGIQGLCPSGWHVPTDPEWKTMLTSAGVTTIGASGFSYGKGANKLKAIGTGQGSTGTATNTSGFSALAGGDRDSYGIYYGMGLRFIFWTSTEVSSGSQSAYQYSLWAENDTVYRYNDAQKITGFSCRCVMNTGTSGINDLQQGYLNVYPNPAENVLNIDFNASFVLATYEIVDAIGQKVSGGKISNTQLSLPVDGLKNGYYFIIVQVDNKKFQRKFVITAH